MNRALAENSLPDLLEKTKTSLGREFVGPCPFARVNLLKLYLACLEVWKDIAIKVHVCKATEMFDLTTQDVDMKLPNKKKAATLKDHSAMAMMRDSLVQVFGGKKMADFYWKEL
jgi:hypothetical protein